MFKWLFKKKGCAKHMNNKLEVIGIDHGWSMMKTISQVFVTGVKEITTTPALFGDVLEYEGKFYKVGTVRQEVKDTKVEDDSFYLLTLAAVAKELKRRGLAESKVFLAVGLPLTRFGAEKNDFIKYLTKNKRVSFKYENEPYHIEIDDVAVFPQCYAAVVDKIPAMAKKTLIVDIGSWTIDIMPVINKSPDESKCVTIPKGLIKARRSVIQFEDVSFEYPGAETDSIHHISLDVKEGEFLVLTGGSGCGKTTLTRLVNGLGEQFYEGTLKGRITLLGRNISEYPLYEIGKKVGSIFQDPKSQFFASITEDEISFGCENYGVPYEELDRRVSSAIKRINGDMLRGKEIYPMSSGEKQKIAVASVNAVDPEIYVFDEPSANLDMYSVEALKNLMGGLKAEGHTIIVAEHRLYYLTDLADRFLYMENGSIKEEWTAGELRSIPEEKRRAIGIRAADLHHIEVDISPVKEKDMTMEVKDLAFSYRKHPVFHDVSFQAYAGDLIAIVGHNGIGKTTLSNILCGMQKEKEGQVIYNGTKVSKGKRKNFAYFVMQNTDCQLFGDSVEEELLLNGKGSTQEQRDDLLKLYGLFEWKERHPATLSGGQKQRLTLAVSDWIDTPVLILDEPTSGLDFKNMMRISEHLKALAQKGKTILIITHDYEFAAMTCNRVLHFVDEGHVETFPLQENLSRLYSCLMCQ